jgi:hypothetical protein
MSNVYSRQLQFLRAGHIQIDSSQVKMMTGLLQMAKPLRGAIFFLSLSGQPDLSLFPHTQIRGARVSAHFS